MATPFIADGTQRSSDRLEDEEEKCSPNTSSDRSHQESHETPVSGQDLEPAISSVRSVEDIPPDGGYGWVCVGCVFTINGHTWGLNSTYGVFLAHYLANNTFPGTTPLEYGFVGGLSISMALLVAPIATITTREFSTRTTLLIGVFLETAALLGASFATQTWHLFLSQGVCFGWGMGFLFVGTVGVVPQWFLQRRSFANSIGSAGSGIFALIYSLSTNAMIQSIGLAWAFRVLAILVFAVNGICAILLKDRNKAVGSVQAAFDFSMFKRAEFNLLLGWGFFSMLGYVVLLFSLPNNATSLGLTAQQGSVIAALLNLGQGLGRPVMGFYSDRIGRINMALVCTFLTGLFSLVIWIFAKSYGMLIFFALICGPVAGTYWATIGPVGAEVVGLKSLPSALSLVWLVLVLPTTFSEPIGLQLRTTTGDQYLHAQIFSGFMYIAAALCMWFLRAWKIAELEKEGMEEGEEERAAMNMAEEIAQKRHEADMKDENGNSRDKLQREELRRTTSVAASVKSKVKAARGLWAWKKV